VCGSIQHQDDRSGAAGLHCAGRSMIFSAEERIGNPSRMVETAVAKRVEHEDIYVDPLMFPISVNTDSGNHVLKAIGVPRRTCAPEIHITGGFSNVSFGSPCRIPHHGLQIRGTDSLDR